MSVTHRPTSSAKRPEVATFDRETLKRDLGGIARRIASRYFMAAHCFDTPSGPLLIMCHVDAIPTQEQLNLVQISVEAAKKDWNAVVLASLFLGVEFLIRSRREPLAVLKRHPIYRHKAFEYLHSEHFLKADMEIGTEIDTLNQIKNSLSEVDSKIHPIAKSIDKLIQRRLAARGK